MTNNALFEVDTAEEDSPEQAIDRAFGEENRARLLSEFFINTSTIDPADAWKDLYRLLLWPNRTIGLAHCYESDKCQPGEPWYPRSLAFHGWVADHLGTTPAGLTDEIDWLFRRASADLAKLVVEAAHTAKVAKQRAPYEGKGFPLPGEDPELTEIILDGLRHHLSELPPENILRALVERIQVHVGQENKRKNLIGEGFEDALAAVLRRVPGVAQGYEIRTRATLQDLPNFNPGPDSDKLRQVDLALIRRSDQRRTLITAKWSIRADREEQFRSDFDDYSRLNRGRKFDYVLITNEFDAARLVRACERPSGNADLFTGVVHVNPAGPIVAYGKATKVQRWKASKMLRHVEEKRLTSLEDWLTALVDQA
jgi:hypothetical protein